MADDELPRVLQLLWGRAEPRRGPKPAYTITDIAHAAVRLADEQGLPAVSMSAVAAELGATTMALYRYVDAKDDLYTAMIDVAYGAPPVGRARGGWRRQLEAWARANRGALVRHPWIVQIPVSDPPLSPNALRWMERGVSSFAGTPLSEQQKLSCLLLVEVYVRGQVLLSTGLADSATAAADADGSVYTRRLAQLIAGDEFPGITAALQSRALEDDDDFADTEFDFGLATVLDGIAARIERARSRR
jgi:AcrR family transcriptional regulator